MIRLEAAVFLTSICISTASADWGGWGSWHGGGQGDDGYGGGYGGGDDQTGSGFGGSSNGFPGAGTPGFDVQTATNHRRIHGILAAVAFLILFPLGAIFMRLVPGRFAIWIHALTQSLGYAVFVAAAGLGFYLVHEVRIPPNGGSLLGNSSINYHPIIGIVIFVALFFQPLLGFVHHLRFKQLRRRQIWSHLHLWNGRIMIPLGIINGGLGLKLAGASSSIKTAYTVVAAIMGGLWLVIAVFAEIRRQRGSQTTQRRRSRRRSTNQKITRQNSED